MLDLGTDLCGLLPDADSVVDMKSGQAINPATALPVADEIPMAAHAIGDIESLLQGWISAMVMKMRQGLRGRGSEAGARGLGWQERRRRDPPPNGTHREREGGVGATTSIAKV